MRLYLAVAVLMLALVAYTEAQEETNDQTFGQRVVELGKKMVEKANTALETFQSSDVVVKSKSWLDDVSERIKASLGDLIQ